MIVTLSTYFVLGLLFGGVICFLALFMQHLFRKTVYTSDELVNCYGMLVIDEIHSKKYEGIRGYIYSTIAYAKRYRRENKKAEGRMSRVVLAIDALAARKDCGKVLIVDLSTGQNDAIRLYMDRLVHAWNGAIKGRVIEMISKNDIDYASHSGNTGVVLLTEARETTFDEVKETLLVSGIFSFEILGGILIEA